MIDWSSLTSSLAASVGPRRETCDASCSTVGGEYGLAGSRGFVAASKGKPQEGTADQKMAPGHDLSSDFGVPENEIADRFRDRPFPQSPATRPGRVTCFGDLVVAEALATRALVGIERIARGPLATD